MIGAFNSVFHKIYHSREGSNSRNYGSLDKKREEMDTSCHNYQYGKEEFKWEQNYPPLIIPALGFRVELGGTLKQVDEVVLERQEKNSLFYKEHFYGKEHVNYIGGDENAPLIVSISLEPMEGFCWAIVRTKHDDLHIMVPYSKSKKTLLQAVQKEHPEIFLSNVKFKEVKDEKLCSKLLHLEDRLLVKSYKFGVLYCKEGQTYEDDMFSNSDTTPIYEEFLKLLGEKIPLKGYGGFRGGLDVDNNTTGVHSIVTTFQGFEIMFHVSTLLPETENRQQLERKRHIGNDVVVIIFQDGPVPFSPTTITSKFNHVYAVVQYDPKESSSGVSKYRFALACKEGVSPHGPVLPNPPLFEAGSGFRDFLLTKIINAERAAYYAPGFGQTRTRRLWMKGILEQHAD